MFTDETVAVEVIEVMRRVHDELNGSLIELEAKMPREEWVNYRYAVGHILGEVVGQVLDPISRRHPQLKPMVYGREDS
jgi:hypothetical protein